MIAPKPDKGLDTLADLKYTDSELELREQLRNLKRPTKQDFRYPIEAYEEDLVDLIEAAITTARLEERNKFADLLTKGKAVSVSLPNGVVTVEYSTELWEEIQLSLKKETPGYQPIRRKDK